MSGLFGGGVSSTTAQASPSPAPAAPASPSAGAASAAPQNVDVNALIAEAARDLADYQRLTAEGKLGEAGQKLEALKSALDRLAKQKR